MVILFHCPHTHSHTYNTIIRLLFYAPLLPTFLHHHLTTVVWIAIYGDVYAHTVPLVVTRAFPSLTNGRLAFFIRHLPTHLTGFVTTTCYAGVCGCTLRYNIRFPFTIRTGRCDCQFVTYGRTPTALCVVHRIPHTHLHARLWTPRCCHLDYPRDVLTVTRYGCTFRLPHVPRSRLRCSACIALYRMTAIAVLFSPRWLFTRFTVYLLTWFGCGLPGTFTVGYLDAHHSLPTTHLPVTVVDPTFGYTDPYVPLTHTTYAQCLYCWFSTTTLFDLRITVWAVTLFAFTPHY